LLEPLFYDLIGIIVCGASFDYLGLSIWYIRELFWTKTRHFTLRKN